jgi:hypothetical protein
MVMQEAHVKEALSKVNARLANDFQIEMTQTR